MRLAYVAGPYRSRQGIVGVKRNIDAAMAVARELWAKGFAVICPHGNSAFMDGPDIGDDAFLAGDLEILRRCDVIVMAPGWEESSGARAEYEFALQNGLQAFFWPRDRGRIGRAASTAPVRWQGAAKGISPIEAAAVLGKHAAEVRRGARDGSTLGDLFQEVA